MHRRSTTTAALLAALFVLTPAVADASDSGSGRTIYATTASVCYPGSPGSGTAASPYCNLQVAVDAAVPGDTIKVAGAIGSSSGDVVRVRTSGISIVGVGDHAQVQDGLGKSALILDGVTDVTVRNLMLASTGGVPVEVRGSSRITLDSLHVYAYGTPVGRPDPGPLDAVRIDGASSGVTVSRSYLDTRGWKPGASGISVAAGASQVTLASNVVVATGISATGVAGLNVVGNTIQRSCAPAVAVDGASTGVSIQNNLLEDVTEAAKLVSTKESCKSRGAGWAPDIAVSAQARTGSTADYNAFHSHADNATAPYAWGGVEYPTLDAFRAAVPDQGRNDVVDASEPKPVRFRLDEAYADAKLRPGAASVDSANPDAPGRLDTDFFGTGGYRSRGAVQYDPRPEFALGLDARSTSAHAVALTMNITDVLTQPVDTKLVIDWGDGTTTADSYYGPAGSRQAWHTYAKLGAYRVTVTATTSHGDVITSTVQVATTGSNYTAYGPTRLLDTRTGTGAPVAKVQPNSSVRIRIAGNGSIPAGVTAAVLNVTVTDGSHGGYITAFASGTARPLASNVNFTAGQTVPNLTVVPVGADGWVELFNGSQGTVDLIADIAGYFTKSAAGGYTSVDPARLMDTRDGTGVTQGRIPGRGSVELPIAGSKAAPLPGSGITAVALNVTTTGATAGGYLTAHPSGAPTPLASNLNFGPGQTIANSVVVPVGPDGKIRIFNGSGSPTDVIVDVVGYYGTTGAAYMPVTPKRLVDTRDWSYEGFGRGQYVWQQFGGLGADVSGAVLNTTVANTAGQGFLTVAPDPNTALQYADHVAVPPVRPLVSTLNWQPGEVVPNLVQASTGPTKLVDFWNSSSGSAALVVDLFGYYDRG